MKKNLGKKIVEKKFLGKNFWKKSGNWGLDEIDCHRSHKGQCTSEKTILEKKNFEKKSLKKKVFEKIFFEKRI